MPGHCQASSTTLLAYNQCKRPFTSRGLVSVVRSVASQHTLKPSGYQYQFVCNSSCRLDENFLFGPTSQCTLGLLSLYRRLARVFDSHSLTPIALVECFGAVVELSEKLRSSVRCARPGMMKHGASEARKHIILLAQAPHMRFLFLPPPSTGLRYTLLRAYP